MQKNGLLAVVGGGAPAASKSAAAGTTGCAHPVGRGGGRTSYYDMTTAGCVPCSACGTKGMVTAKPCGPLEDATCADSCLSTVRPPPSPTLLPPGPSLAPPPLEAVPCALAIAAL